MSATLALLFEAFFNRLVPFAALDHLLYSILWSVPTPPHVSVVRYISSDRFADLIYVSVSSVDVQVVSKVEVCIKKDLSTSFSGLPFNDHRVGLGYAFVVKIFCCFYNNVKRKSRNINDSLTFPALSQAGNLDEGFIIWPKD